MLPSITQYITQCITQYVTQYNTQVAAWPAGLIPRPHATSFCNKSDLWLFSREGEGGCLDLSYFTGSLH